jgi:hypothetical protein
LAFSRDGIETGSGAVAVKPSHLRVSLKADLVTEQRNAANEEASGDAFFRFDIDHYGARGGLWRLIFGESRRLCERAEDERHCCDTVLHVSVPFLML